MRGASGAHIQKQPNIYDLVEQAAARHAIPRLQLWQEVAKALTDQTLRILNSLSEKLNPTGAPALTLAHWLNGFRAAVDHYNDPNRGMVRILKNIHVNKGDFDRWFRKANKNRRGPRSGTTGFREADGKIFSQISRLIRDGKARSPHDAALKLAYDGQLAGGGTEESKAKRVAGRYLKAGRSAR